MSPLPLPVRIAAGLAATAVEQARDLPRLVVEFPVTAVSQALQASMRVQQKVTELAIKGDKALGAFNRPAEDPEWATFDEDLPERSPGTNGHAAVTPITAALRSVEVVGDLDDEESPAGSATGTEVAAENTANGTATVTAIGRTEDAATTDGTATDGADTDTADSVTATDSAGSTAAADTAKDGGSGTESAGASDESAAASATTPESAPTAAPGATPTTHTASKPTATKPTKPAASKPTKPVASKPSAPKPAAKAPAKAPVTKAVTTPRTAASTEAPSSTEAASTTDAPAVTPPGVLPRYPTMTLPQLRGSLRSLNLAGLQELLLWETAHDNRPPYVTMLSNRITTVREG